MRLALVFLAVLALCGCTMAQHEAAATTAGKVAAAASAGQAVVGSDAAKAVTSAVTPAVPVAEPIRFGIEHLLGALAGLAGIVAGWQTRKAKQEEARAEETKRERIEMQRAIDDQKVIDAAFERAHKSE